MRFDKIYKKNMCNTDEPCVSTPQQSYITSVDEMLDDYMLRTRRLWLVGEINELMATSICSYLQMFSLVNDPIYLYINSPGGCVASGYAIIDQMIACTCPVYTVVRGQAHSMGAIIAAFGTINCRYASPNSSMMLHSMIVHGIPDTINKQMNMMNFAHNDYISKIAALARRTKMTQKQLLAITEETKWMSPKQAIGIGLVDGIWTPKMERLLNGQKK